MWRFFIIMVVFFLVPISSPADATGYGGQISIKTSSANYTVTHWHDWSRSKKIDSLFFDYKKNCFVDHRGFFNLKKNDFARLKVYRKSDGILIFQYAVPALTNIWVSPDEKFLLGLSNVMLRNPYQLVIYSLETGELLHKEHFSSRVAQMTKKGWEKFLQKHPQSIPFLKDRTWQVQEKIYVDYSICGMPNSIGNEAWHELFSYEVPHPNLRNASESVTNWVLWFDKQNPDPKIDGSSQTGYYLSLNAPRWRSDTFYPYRICIPFAPSPLPTAR
jgi:hypothetical protein